MEVCVRSATFEGPSLLRYVQEGKVKVPLPICWCEVQHATTHFGSTLVEATVEGARASSLGFDSLATIYTLY